MKHTPSIVDRSVFSRICLSLALACGCIGLAGGCKSPQTAESAAMASAVAQAQADAGETLVLREGDTIRINFPAAPNLSSVQPIRRDGRITLPLVGELQAAGFTPTQLEKRLLEAYGTQLQTKEVSVSIESSAFPIYVTGSVLRPGKIMSDRPITALEAIMEAGGFDYTKANLKKVRVIRYEGGRQVSHSLNMKATLDGTDPNPFKLKPSDILYVPERFTWF